MRDIAREAGVAQSTVSRVLNKVPTQIPIAPETRQRVLQAADRLAHVQIADPAQRGFPRCAAGEPRYEQFFAALRRIGYRGRISIEAQSGDFAADAAPSLAFLRAMTAAPLTAAASRVL